MVKKKGMPINIGIKRLSILKEKGLISEKIFSDAKELLIQSEMKIPINTEMEISTPYHLTVRKPKFKNVSPGDWIKAW